MKHGTYVIICTIIIFIFFLFQFAVFNFGWSNKTMINASYSDFDFPPETMHISGKENSNETVYDTLGEPQYYVIAPFMDKSAKNIVKSLTLIKKSYAVYSSLDEMGFEINANITGLIICEGNLDNIGNIDILFSYANAGKDIVFAKRFDTDAQNFILYHDRMGIVSYKAPYKHEGIDFLNKLLISGVFFNANIATFVNDIVLNGKCLVFAVGYNEDIEKYSDRNPLIWRTFWDNGAIYCFNTDLLDDFTSIGLLVGVLSMDKDVFFYPVINTNMVILDGLPYLSRENEDNILKTYSRNVVQFQFDNVWIDLLSITKNFNIRYSLYPKIGKGSEEIEKEVMESFGKTIVVNKFEVGSYYSRDFLERFPDYKRISALRYSASEITNEIVFDESDFSYSPTGIVHLPIISKTDTAERVNRDKREEIDNLMRFKAFSVASALGYVSHHCDLITVFEDKSQQDLWSGYSLNFIEEYYPITKTYDFIDKDTASMSAKKIKTYLDMTPQVKVSENEIFIKGHSDTQTSYVIRTKRKIKRYKNCVVQDFKNDYYYIKLSGEDAVLYTEDNI